MVDVGDCWWFVEVDGDSALVDVVIHVHVDIHVALVYVFYRVKAHADTDGRLI